MSEHATVVEESNQPNLHVDRWEALWMRISFAVLAVFVIGILIAAFAYNIQLPGATARVDPNNLQAPGSMFENPGLRELAPGKYEAYLIAQAVPWQFIGAQDYAPLTFPEDSEVTFYVTSMDIQHGFKVVNTNINMMVLPGQVSKLTTTFDTPGEYNIICHEYCGTGHHTMWGKIVVESKGE